MEQERGRWPAACLRDRRGKNMWRFKKRKKRPLLFGDKMTSGHEAWNVIKTGEGASQQSKVCSFVPKTTPVTYRESSEERRGSSWDGVMEERMTSPPPQTSWRWEQDRHTRVTDTTLTPAPTNAQTPSSRIKLLSRLFELTLLMWELIWAYWFKLHHVCKLFS